MNDLPINYGETKDDSYSNFNNYELHIMQRAVEHRHKEIIRAITDLTQEQAKLSNMMGAIVRAIENNNAKRSAVALGDTEKPVEVKAYKTGAPEGEAEEVVYSALHDDNYRTTTAIRIVLENMTGDIYKEAHIKKVLHGLTQKGLVMQNKNKKSDTVGYRRAK